MHEYFAYICTLHMSGACGCQRGKVWNPLELLLQMSPMWVLGIEPGFSARESSQCFKPLCNL